MLDIIPKITNHQKPSLNADINIYNFGINAAAGGKPLNVINVIINK